MKHNWRASYNYIFCQTKSFSAPSFDPEKLNSNNSQNYKFSWYRDEKIGLYEKKLYVSTIYRGNS